MDALGEILDSVDSIVVVGCSTDPSKAAHSVPARMQQAGWKIIPVHPTADEILGERAYRRIADVPGPIEMVDVFRPPAQAAGVAAEAAAAGARILWLQLGIASDEARRIADEAGMTYVEDACLAVVQAANHLVKA